MTMMTKAQKDSIDRIMKLIHDVADDSRIEAVILAELNSAYDRGAESIRNSPDYHYREDMGR